jgi:CBS domain-containing protein
MSGMLRVRDIMTPQVLTVSAEARVDHAVWSLSAKGITGAPVCDAEGKVIGVLSRSDLIDMEAHSLVAGETLVSRIMTPEVVAVHPDAPASEAVELMVARSIHRVVVMEHERELVGILTSMDVMKAILAGRSSRVTTCAPRTKKRRVCSRRCSDRALLGLCSGVNRPVDQALIELWPGFDRGSDRPVSDLEWVDAGPARAPRRCCRSAPSAWRSGERCALCRRARRASSVGLDVPSALVAGHLLIRI